MARAVSSGTLLAATGFGQNGLTAGLLYYLPSSTLAVGALFLLSDLIDRWRDRETSGQSCGKTSTQGDGQTSGQSCPEKAL